MTRLLASLAVALCVVYGCAGTGDPLTVADVTGPLRFGSADNVMHVSRLYIAGQPDEQGFRDARASGVTTVINLRTPDETSFDDEEAARDAGLAYYQVPVSGSGESFDRDAFERISALVAAHPDDKILLHCSSGNRVGAWLAAHLVEDHGMAPGDALPIARRAGMTRSDVEARVRRYLGVPPEE